MSTIKEMLEAKADMEDHIQRATSDAVNNFKKRTGLTPMGICVSMVETTTIDDTNRQHHVGEVTTVVQL